MAVHTILKFGVIGPTVALWLLIFGLWYRCYLRVRMSRGLLLALAAGAAGVALAYASGGALWENAPFYGNVQHWVSSNGVTAYAGGTTGTRFFTGEAFMAMVMLSFGLFARLYAAWVMDSASDRERLPNATGLRAWLRPMDIVTVAGITAGAYFGMGWSVWGTLAGALALLLAYPLMNVALKGGVAEHANMEEELAEERARVLALVEAGKISGEDGAELIGALGQSRKPVPEEPGRFSKNVRPMLLGAVLVVVGFCLPWFALDLGREMDALRERLGAMGRGIPGAPALLQMATAAMSQGPVLSVRGGEISWGLGWIILAMGLAVAALPLLWPQRAGNRPWHRALSLAGLTAGTVLLVYLATGAAAEMTIGIFLVMAGYVILWVSVVREHLAIGSSRASLMAAELPQ